MGGITAGIIANAICSWIVKTWERCKSRLSKSELIPLKSGVLYYPKSKAFCCAECSTKDLPIPMTAITQVEDGIEITRLDCPKCNSVSFVKNLSNYLASTIGKGENQ